MSEHPGVSRFEVIDHRLVCGGDRLVVFDVHVSIDVQDDGHTMKVYLNDQDRA